MKNEQFHFSVATKIHGVYEFIIQTQQNLLFVFWEIQKDHFGLSSNYCIVLRIPVSIEKHHRIWFNSMTIGIAMPAVVSMCSVFNLHRCVTKTRFPKCWIFRLWLRHAAKNTKNKLKSIFVTFFVISLFFALIWINKYK